MGRHKQAACGASVAWILVLGGCVAPAEDEREPERWWKGNTHTHTLWSDGNTAPESISAWYKERGYDFLVLSDHNVLSEGERWFPISSDGSGRLLPEHVEDLRERFGDDHVHVRPSSTGGREMRLMTLHELRATFEVPGEFVFIQGEELTDSFEKQPVHVNGLNLAEAIPPQGGGSLREVLQRNVDAVIAQGQALGRPTLAHVNHPNFGWGLTWNDVAAVRGERFFEVYNGHPSVRNQGDATHPGTERMWDLALTWRLSETDLGLLYGLATDDAHDYQRWGDGRANPGRGWVQVRAARLTPDDIVLALRRGAFYATSGVELRSVEHSESDLRVSIEARAGTAYHTRFIGTRRGSDAVGATLFETDDNPAVYTFTGDELYVRAVVTSSELHPNPYAAGDLETAWVQPVRPGDAGSGQN